MSLEIGKGVEIPIIKVPQGDDSDYLLNSEYILSVITNRVTTYLTKSQGASL